MAEPTKNCGGLVIGYGNELRGDDGLGPYIAARVEEQCLPHVRTLTVHQLTPELTAFLEDAFVALASYVDEELAALAAEHRRASAALETDPRQPGSRLESPNWAVVARTSRLAGEIARTSAEDASALRREFQALVAGLTVHLK